MDKKKQIRILAIVAAVLACVVFGYYLIAKSRQNVTTQVAQTTTDSQAQVPTVDEPDSTNNWNHTYRVVAHALGGIDEYDYTNSLEAFEYNYANGDRLFETDLCLTSDDEIVLTHTWEDFRQKLTNMGGYDALSLEEFKDTKIYDKYTTLSFDDLLDLMVKYPDFYVIVDSKMFDVENTILIYDKVLDYINAKDPNLIDRFIPQAYNPDIIDVLQQDYPFKNIIYTLYSIYDTSDGQSIYQTVKDKNIKTVVMHMDNEWATRVISDIYAYAVMDGNQDSFQIYIHTVNDEQKALDIVNEYHFFGIYSDFIDENEFNTLLQENKAE